MKKLFLIVFILISVQSFSQLVQYPTNYGIGYRRTGADTLLWVPKDTFNIPSSLLTRTHLAIKNGVSYYWNGSLWSALSGGGGGSYTAGYGLSLGGSVFSADSATLAAYFLRRKDSATGTNLNGYLTRTSVNDYTTDSLFGVQDNLFTANRSVAQGGYDFTYTGNGSIKINGGVSGSTAKFQIGKNTASQFAPTLSVGTVPVNSIHSFFYFDDTLTAANTSSVPLQGFQMNRYVTQGENNVTVSFKNGALFGLVVRTKDSAVLAPQGSDAVYGLQGGLVIRKRSDQTTRSSLRSGLIPGVDASVGLLGNLNLAGGTVGNNFHLYGDWAAITAYHYNDSSPGVDTIDNYIGFLSYGSSQTYIKRGYNFMGSGIGGTADTVWGIYNFSEDYNYLSSKLGIGGIANEKQDSTLQVGGGIWGKGGVRFDGLPTFADTTNYKPVVMNSSGTIYKATYWPGGGSPFITGVTDANGFDLTVSSGNLSVTTTVTDKRIPYSNSGALANSTLRQVDADSVIVDATGAKAAFTVNGHEDGGIKPIFVTAFTGARIASFNGNGTMDLQTYEGVPAAPDPFFGRYYASADGHPHYVNSSGTDFDLTISDSSKFTLQRDTIALASFGAGGNQAGDTTSFSTSTIYGSFYNDGSDTLVITSIRAVLQGTSPSLVPTVYYNDSLNVTAGATKLVNSPSAVTNTTTGASATPDNKKIPPGVWVWVKTETVTTKPTYFSLTLLGYKKRR